MVERNGDRMKQGLFQGKVLEKLNNMETHVQGLHTKFDVQAKTDKAQDDRISSLETSRTYVKGILYTLSIFWTALLAYIGFKGGLK